MDNKDDYMDDYEYHYDYCGVKIPVGEYEVECSKCQAVMCSDECLAKHIKQAEK
jgi:hypothetical protein